MDHKINNNDPNDNLTKINSHEILLNPAYDRQEENRNKFLKYKIPLILNNMKNTIGNAEENKYTDEMQFLKNKYRQIFN